jgi:hypothetical protein
MSKKKSEKKDKKKKSAKKKKRKPGLYDQWREAFKLFDRIKPHGHARTKLG